MRNIARLAALAACLGSGALAFAGCDQSSVAQVEAATKTAAVSLCGFEPAADTVARIVIPLASTAAGVGSPAMIEHAANAGASAICGAVTARGARRGGIGHAPTVRGVAIHGRFRDGRAL